MWMSGMARRSRRPLTTASLSRWAPWLPPVTSTTKAASGICRDALAARGSAARISGRTGWPVTTTRRPAKEAAVAVDTTETQSAQRARRRLARSGITSDTWSMIGRRRRRAAGTTEAAMNPPVASRTSGCRRLSRRRAWQPPAARWQRLVTAVGAKPYGMPRPDIGCGSKPRAASMSVSSGRREVRKCSSISGAIWRNVWATAMDGTRCPAVPPPAKTTRLMRHLCFCPDLPWRWTAITTPMPAMHDTRLLPP